jgi:phosphate acyltransferase
VIRIALDAMGTDNAPEPEVAGVAMALSELPPTFQIQLVGRRDVIEPALKKHKVAQDRLTIVDAADVVAMGDKPLQAVRSKPGSSIMVGLRLQKEGKSDAFISAGNTGAVMAASTLLLRLHRGIQRPAIGALFPTAGKPVLVLDGGANVDCDARELVGFGHLGTVYARDVLGRENPTVGLLNIGEEDEKGNAAVKEANELLKQSPGIRFVGNVEGRDILAGECEKGPIDVVVADGFVGNVVLKFYESVARFIVSVIQERAPDVLQRGEIRDLLRRLDYSEYGGAPLLGVKGVAIICHGSSPPNAIKNAIRVAAQSVESHLSQHIGAEVAPGAVA